MKTLVTLLFIVGFSDCFLKAQSSQFFPDEMVVTSTVLTLRDAPSANGKKVVSLNRGSLVQFIEAWNDGEYVQIDTTGPYAPWYKVRYQDKIGYAFGADLSGTTVLAYEGDMVEEIAPLQWFGVYERDSFADEIRPISLKAAEEYNEVYESTIKILKTNQKDVSKFIIGVLKPLKPGYAGPLGMFHVGDFSVSDALFPGSTLSIYPGQELNDTLFKPSWQLAATGCARFENDFVQVSDYKLFLVDYYPEVARRQDLSQWVQTELPEISPSVSLLWYGDLDGDNKPDAIIQDCPYESGCRASLFLSSKAKPGEYLRKVCEHFWPGD
jgi:hypothetical protein